jgi:asparagine synthase (glutamine-hydrolysing)
VSGIAGIVNLDQAPVDPVLLREMTQHMAFRGPDAQETWIGSHVGFGHAMLRTTFEMAEEQQPRSLDGRVWITADARIDAREELIHKLEANACHELAHANDAELILHAYRLWDTSCVHHLLGDFAFAIWDTSQQRLFCARDHFGVRQFYYARVGGCLIFSNNLDTIRRHPRVSDKLNDLAIINFLLFRYQPRIDQTSFADIQSLLPAHTLMWEGGTTTISRYWTLPIEDPICYKRPHDYVDHFRQLLDTVVADRMRTDRAGVLMSGGMDSSSMAATIHGIRVQKKSNFALKAFTYVYDQLIPDQERHYAGLVASYLDIPIHFAVLDDKKWFDGWDREGFRFPEPIVNDSLWNDDDCVRKAALDDDVRVFYNGWGPDTMLSEPTRYLRLLRHGRIGDFIRQTGGFIMRYRQRPLAAVGRCWQRLWGIVPHRCADVDALALLAPSITEHIKIPKQWWQFPNQPQKHPWRPHTYSYLTSHYWTLGFQQYDAANWHAPVEFRYPYFDIRLVRYLLRVPVLPLWSSNKGLLREAMRGKLPELVRIRPKAPLAGEPGHSYADWVLRNNMPGAQVARYVDANRVTRLLGETGSDQEAAVAQRLIALNHWLERHKQRIERRGCVA